MKVRDVTAFNFLSYKHLRLQFINGLYLIHGENGAGKSSIMEALYWGLYGKLLRNALSDDLINVSRAKKKKGTKVTVCLANGIKVERYRRHPIHKNALRLWKNGTDISGSSTDDTQNKIEQFLGFDATSFAIVNLFSEGTIKFITASDSDKKKVLDKFFPNLDAYRKIVKRQMNKSVDNIMANEELIVGYNSGIVTLRQEVEDLKSHIPNMVQLKELKISLKNIALKLKDISFERYELYMKKINDAAKTIQEIVRQQELISSLREDIADISTRETAVAASRKCPTCKQMIKESVVEDLSAGYEEEKVKIRGKIAELKRELHILKATALSDETNRKYHVYVGQFSKNLKLQDLQVGYTHKIDRLEGEYSQYSTSLVNVRKRLTTMKENKKVASNQLAKLKIGHAHHKFLYYALHDKGSQEVIPVKAFLYELILPLLQKEAQKYLTLFDPTMAIEVILEKREKISVIVRKYRSAGKFILASGGEKRKADLAISLALRSLFAAQTNVLFLDDVFDVLDAAGIQNVVRVLNTLGESAIFCVSPHPYEIDFFENVFEVSKDSKGYSMIKRTAT